MKTLPALLIFLLLQYNFNAYAWQQPSNVLKPIYLQQKSVFGTKPENWILNAHGLAWTSKDTLVVSDKLDYKLKKFSSNGTIVRETGRRGKGPGEFRGPGPMDSYKNHIAVVDFASTRIQIFSSSLEYESTFYAPGPVFNLKFDTDGNLWLGILPSRMGENLVKVTLTGKILQTIGLRNSSDNEFDNLFSFTLTQSGNIVIAYAFQNKIELWQSNGIFKTEFEIPGIPRYPRKRKHSRGLFAKALEVPEDNIFWSVAVDGKDNLYVLAATFSPAPDRDVYVLDSHGNLISILTLPERSYHISIGPNGELYSIEKDRTLVKRYLMMKSGK